MSALKQLYQQVILDHSKKPRHFHVLDPFSHCATGHNPLCGDRLKVFVRMNGEVIEEVSFVGEGCAISKASASLMTEIMSGKTMQEFHRLYTDFHQVLTSQDPIPDTMGKLKALVGVRDFPARVKCATLAWHTFDAALNNQDNVKTE